MDNTLAAVTLGVPGTVKHGEHRCRLTVRSGTAGREYALSLNDGPASRYDRDVSIAPLEQPDGVKQSDVMTVVTAREGPGRTARDQRFSGQVPDGGCFAVRVSPRGGWKI